MIGGYKGELSYDEKNYDTGIVRVKVNDNTHQKEPKYEYFYVKTRKKVSPEDLDRILKLKLPPAWDNVWISGTAKSDIQAVGIDSKNRKQYKYNDKHIKSAEKEKFLRLFKFIGALPKLEKIINKHLLLHVYNKDHVIATMLELVQELHLRVGKEQYAKTNKSYGISSLKKVHVKLSGDEIKFNFKGKSNQRLSYTLHDAKIRQHLDMLLKLNGDKLFQYIDDNGIIRKVYDIDINDYIQKYMGPEFSAKDFRTYAANYYFVKTLLNETKKNTNNIKKNILNAIKVSAKHLSHTKNISKKSYIMSFCIELYMKHPEFFVSKKYDNPTTVLTEILKIYKKKMIK